jgi:outer membrane protein assembly factor BamB
MTILHSRSSCLNFSWAAMLAFASAVIASSACDAQLPRGRTSPANPHVASAHDWPQWRGLNRDGLSHDKDLLDKWPAGGPPVAWKAVGIGEGFSTVSVAGDRVFTMGDLDDACYVFSLDRDNGNLVWKTKIGKTGGNYKGPRCTPTVDGDRVYALGQFGDLVCCDMKNGEIVWRKSLPDDFAGKPGGWNYTESPLIDGERLICTPGGSEATMVALQKETGDVIWKAKTPDGEAAGYASPVVAEIGGVRQYVQLLSQGAAAFAADDGRLLWRYGDRRDRFAGNTANIPTPIVHGDLIFFAAGYGRGGGLVRVKKDADEFTAEERWFSSDLQNKHGGVVWVGDYLYGGRDDNSIPWCADARNGNVVWTGRSSEGNGSVSVTYADDHLYWRYQNGHVALSPASPEGYEEVSSFDIPSGSDPSWPHPVVVGGRLYLRDQDTLWCYNVSKDI